MKNQPPLDGISLVTLLEGRMKSRPKPMGFWDHPTGGISTPSKKWMRVDDPSRLRLDAGKITKQYPEDSFPGHSAWLDWPWKLHRIEKKGPIKFELYNLADDPQESNDCAAAQPERAKAMKAQLEAWLKSVAQSLNGADYQ